MSGPQPITYQEILSYVSLRFNRRYPQVSKLVSIVEALDDAFLKDYADKHSNT